MTTDLNTSDSDLTITTSNARGRLLDPGLDLTLRPMRYPLFFDRFKDAIKNTWTVEEVDLHTDLADLQKLTEAERHLVNRLVAFFATGDTIVANNLVLNLYQHVNAPEARLYLSRQLFEEAVHVQFYLNLLDTYLPDENERIKAFSAVENIPSIRRKAEFCFKWIDSLSDVDRLETTEHRRQFILNLICFAACIEGLFFTVPSPTSTSCVPVDCCTGWPREPTGCSVTSRCTWPSRSTSSPPPGRRSRNCSTTSSRPKCARCSPRRSTAKFSSPRTSSPRASPGCRSPTCAPTWSTSPTAGWSTSGSTSSTARRTPSHSWNCRRPGTLQLLRTPGLRLPGRSRRDILRRRGLLAGKARALGLRSSALVVLPILYCSVFVVWRAYSRRSPAGRRSGFFRDPLTAMALLPSLGHLAINKENYGNFASETPQPLKDPSGNTVFPGFPADILAAFRLYSVMAQLILWTTIGVLFAPLAEKLLTPTPPAPVVEDEPATV